MKQAISKAALVSLALAALFFLVWVSAGGQTQDPLLFPRDAFTLETKTMRTSAGEKEVTYRSYRHIPYVANPVDKDYQSLNVSDPVEVDGAAVDATNAPILFAIGVGGYMSVKNAGSGGGMMGAPPSGPPVGPPPVGGRMGGPPGAGGKTSSNTDLALAAGYVVVSPGCRGRDNRAADGSYYGKAPAASLSWDAGHIADEDPEDFIAWIGNIAGFTGHIKAGK